jgi:dTDP-3-amino-3,4,6-trideoxy-alpha-D-glucose transaminase
MSVPLFASSLEPHHDALVERISAVVRSGRYILGPEVRAFEAEFAEFLGVEHVVGVANGTDALTIALRAMGIKPGDDVIVPSFTFYATVEAVVAVGARPVFCDVDVQTYCLTPTTVEEAPTTNPRAIVAVDLFGNLARTDELGGLGVPILEDAAQAVGSSLGGVVKPGRFATAATFSFFPSKNLPCLGDGGAIATNDEEVAALARRLRFHGSDDKETFTEVGYNSRLDEVQAAVLRALLPEVDGWTAARRRVAHEYDRSLPTALRRPRATDEAKPAWHVYAAQHDRADELIAGLNAAGVESRGYYRTPIHLQPAMAQFGGPSLDLFQTGMAARTNLALPMGTNLSDDDVKLVVDAVRSALEALD